MAKAVKVQGLDRLQRRLKAYERTMASAERRALGIAARNARAWIAGAFRGAKRNQGTAIVGALEPMSEWHRILHGKRRGGALGDKNSWANRSVSRHAREVSVLSRLDDVAGKWQHGDRAPEGERLQKMLIAAARKTGNVYDALESGTRAYFHRIGYGGKVPTPAVPIQPARPVVSKLVPRIRKSLKEDYESILAKIKK